MSEERCWNLNLQVRGVVEGWDWSLVPHRTLRYRHIPWSIHTELYRTATPMRVQNLALTMDAHTCAFLYIYHYASVATIPITGLMIMTTMMLLVMVMMILMMMLMLLMMMTIMMQLMAATSSHHHHRSRQLQHHHHSHPRPHAHHHHHHSFHDPVAKARNTRPCETC